MIDNLHIRLNEHAIQLRRRKLLMSVFFLLSLLSLLSLAFGFIQNSRLSRQSVLSRLEQETNWAIAQARELSPVSPSRSLQILIDQEKIIQEELAETKNKSAVIRLNLLLNLLKSSKEDIGLVHTINHPELFLDLSLIRSDISASQIVSVGDKLLVLDKNNRRLLSISAENHSGEVIAAGDDLSGVISIAADKQNIFLLFPHQISLISLIPQISQISVPVSDPDQIWQTPVSLAVYAGNIYVLDQGNSEIYKYATLSDLSNSSDLTFGPRRRWLSAGVTPNLSDAIGLSVNGDAWILHNSGKISRFRQGSAFGPYSSNTLNSLISPNHPISFSVSSSGLWLLNPGSITLLDLDSGSFVSQWQIANVNPIGFVVHEQLHKIFLLEPSKIYTVGLP